MERPVTPPPRRSARPQATSPQTPEVARRIEENRLRAKALREQHLAAEAAVSSQPTKRTPSGFIADDISTSARKRAHGQISTSKPPETNRDGRNLGQDDGIQPARKFKKYVDHDFSKMTDTKGGFLSAEDDPHNKVLHAPEQDAKPAHMTLKEWERHQLIKGLQRRKEGPYEPGLGFDAKAKENLKKCEKCNSVEIDWQIEEVFKVNVCSTCKEKYPDIYSLLTKTEAREDYLLTEPELKDPELLPHLSKPNPHKTHWHDMMLFLRCQVEAYAIKKWGSLENLDAQFEKKRRGQKEEKEDKFKSKLQELKKRTRTETYRRNLEGKGGKGFGDRIGGMERHEHVWGIAVENEDGMTVKTCTECNMEIEVLEF